MLTKVLHAQEAGATAVLIFSRDAYFRDWRPQHGDAPEAAFVNISSAIISNEAGEHILELLGTGGMVMSTVSSSATSLSRHGAALLASLGLTPKSRQLRGATCARPANISMRQAPPDAWSARMVSRILLRSHVSAMLAMVDPHARHACLASLRPCLPFQAKLLRTTGMNTRRSTAPRPRRWKEDVRTIIFRCHLADGRLHLAMRTQLT